MSNSAINNALNKQLNLEHFSFYQYLAISAFTDQMGLSGMSNWFRVQSREELLHADKIFNYLLERGHEVELLPIEKPTQHWDSILDVFKFALKQEKNVTTEINSLVNIAMESSNHAANNFLQWFVSEQVEEEAMVEGIIQKLELIKDDKSALLVLDKELSEREAKPSLENS
jgi:ferritin